MTKFKSMLTSNGQELVEKRAENKEKDAKECFVAEKMEVEKKIREIEMKITSMEDMAVRSTDTLVVGEDIDMAEWTNRRINYALELNDLKVELGIIEDLIKQYFE